MASDPVQKILIVDDHRDIREVIRVLLEAEHYSVLEATNGSEAVTSAAKEEPDLVIMDIMMPGISGFQAAGMIRSTSNVPILFLSARSGDQDKVLAYSAGADDYLQKPFSQVELLVKVRALLRRYHIYRNAHQGGVKDEPVDLILRELRVCPERNVVHVDGNKLSLTETEYAILLMLMQRPGQLFTAQEIFEGVWHEPYLHTSNNTIMVHMRNLRKKLGDEPRMPRFIRTVWGRGYRIE